MEKFSQYRDRGTLWIFSLFLGVDRLRLTGYRVWHCAFPTYTNHSLRHRSAIPYLPLYNASASTTHRHIVLLLLFTMVTNWTSWKEGGALGNTGCAWYLVGRLAD